MYVGEGNDVTMTCITNISEDLSNISWNAVNEISKNLPS